MVDSVEIYNIAEAGYTSWPFILFLLAMLIVGAYTALASGALHSLKNKIVFATVITTIGAGVLAYTDKTSSSYARLLQAFNEGRCEIVEGKITQFIPIGKDRHGSESFVVSGRKFIYGHNPAGYNKTTFDGGILGEGLPVRIWSYNGHIAKVEILSVDLQEADSVTTGVAKSLVDELHQELTNRFR